MDKSIIEEHHDATLPKYDTTIIQLRASFLNLNSDSTSPHPS